jgi:hypothetical protein
MQYLRQSTAATVLVGPFVDRTDMYTPETGLAAGTVDEIGVYKHDATALTDISGTTTFTHRAGGQYTATLSATDTNTLGRLTLYVRDDSVCLPVEEEFFVLDANAYDIWVNGTLNNLTGGFGSASPNNLQGHLVAVMSKAASTPTAAGTYNAATDSLEYIGERVPLIEGSGFSTSTDSLEALRDYLVALVAPSVTASSALSGSGFLSDCVSLIRKATDEPSTNPKYTGADLVEMIQVAFNAILTDIHSNTDHPIMIRHSITWVSGAQDYIMHPAVAPDCEDQHLDGPTGVGDHAGLLQQPWRLRVEAGGERTAAPLGLGVYRHAGTPVRPVGRTPHAQGRPGHSSD